MAEKMTCTQCGMPCDAGEYHPYAACLMFTACHNSATVRANLAQPAQAVDVGALRETLFRIAADNHKSALTLGQEGLRGQCIQTSKELHEITRAIGNAQAEGK